MNRFGLLARFNAITLVLVALVALVLGHAFDRYAKHQAAAEARNFAQLAVVPFELHPKGLGQADRPARPPAGRGETAQAFTGGEIVSVRLWDRGGESVAPWVDGQPRLKRAAVAAAAAADGQVVLVPAGEGKVHALIALSTSRDIADVTINMAPIQSRIGGNTRRLQRTAIIVLALLWLVQAPLVAKASRRLRQRAERAHHDARHDELTGLPNRRAFRGVAAGRLRSGVPTAMLLLDLDGFKAINDQLGHTAGDRVLIEMASRLRSAAGADALVARLGGDEFVVLICATDARKRAATISQRLRTTVSQPVDVGRPVQVAASIGIATADSANATLDDTLAVADAAMYADKARRRCPDSSGHARVQPRGRLAPSVA